MPTVSVVIPVYNCAPFISETLQGIARQSFGDREIIVVDDGSSDDTGAVVQKFDPAIHYLRQENHGPAAARNRGVSNAAGEFIAFCDHDDVWNAQHLEQSLDCFKSHPNAAMVFSDAAFCHAKDDAGKTHIAAKVLRRMIDRPVTIGDIWDCWIASMSVVLVRKSVFNAVGGLAPKIWGLDDLHYYLRVAARYEVRFVNYVGCRKFATANNLLIPTALAGLIDCLEDLKANHPAVVRAIGARRLRARLANRYRKLAARQFAQGQYALAEESARKAWRENYLSAHSLVALWRVSRRKKILTHDA
jgi:glycosyltransferase involved in cell wall biosynthesis